MSGIIKLKKINSITFGVWLFIFSSILTSCEHLDKPQQPADTKPLVIQQGTESPVAESTAPGVVHVPDFVASRAPRVGLIFGPGGAKTLAQLGAIQEIERQKIPVVAAVGLEWGALVGALYALNGQSHEADWKISQLPKVDFATSHLFSKKLKATSANEYSAYLNKIFGSERMESTKIPFACTSIKKETSAPTLISKGLVKSVLNSCWQYPPLFSVTDSRAAPYAIAEATAYLKKQGAELIVLINVLESPSQKDFASWDDSSWIWFGWLPVHAALRSWKSLGVNETIYVDTSAFSMTDFEQRLRLIQVGKQGSAAQIDQLIRKYDF